VAIDSGTDTASRLYGDAEVMSGSIVCGNDSLTGGAGNDYLYGDAAITGPAIQRVGAAGDRARETHGSIKPLRKIFVKS
jgi:Ca2+-binding RTX toxin-like protein